MLLRVVFGLNLVSQMQLGWQNDQVWLETALPLSCGEGTSLTLRTPCPGGTGLVLGHCDCLDIVLGLRAYMGGITLRRD